MVTPHYLPHVGGVEQHVHEVATRIAASGRASVEVITTGAELGLAPTGTDGPVALTRLRALPKGRDWLLAPELPRRLRAEPWDVIHLQSYHTLIAPLTMATAARLGVPYVVTFHGGGSSSPVRHGARDLQRRLLGPLLRRAAALVAVAQFEVTEYGGRLGIPAERFALIPNGVDLPDPGPRDPAADAPPGPLIASVGRLERYKGHHRVIEALPHVLRERPGARVWIAGSGPYEAELRALAARLGVEDRVEIGAVPPDRRAEMARRLRASDLVVLLSDFETHPIAALEALSLQRPLLVATGSGLGELADRGLARSVDPAAAPDVIARAMLRELDDPLSPAALDLPTWDDCAAELLALYTRIARARA